MTEIDTCMTDQERRWGVGEMSDGTVNIFAPEELPAKLIELCELERAATGEDDLGDLDDIEKLFGAGAEDDFGEIEHLGRKDDKPTFD